MATDTIEQRPHHGFNVMIRRRKRNLSQESLGSIIGLPQCDVSKLENQEVIEDKILSKIANALGCSLESLRDFDVEYAMNTFNASISDTKDNSVNNSSFSGEITQTFNQTSPELIELYKDTLAAEKEARVKDAEVHQKEVLAKDTEIAYLRKQLEESLKK